MIRDDADAQNGELFLYAAALGMQTPRLPIPACIGHLDVPESRIGDNPNFGEVAHVPILDSAKNGATVLACAVTKGPPRINYCPVRLSA